MTILIGAFIVGITLGLLGSGGSAITVPILVYLVGHDAKVSIAESMAIVGIISMTGAFPKAMAKHVDWRSVIWFGIPGMAGTYLGAWLGGIASDALQLTVFGTVVIVAAIMMLRNAYSISMDESGRETAPPRKRDPASLLKIISEGILVGALTGFVGVGGGFLIVPALLMLEKLPIRTAIGTSLVIIALKSAIGYAKYHYILSVQGISVDIQAIIVFSLIGMIGCAVGERLSTRMHHVSLKKAFAVFMVLIGVFVIYREGGKLLQQPSARATSVQTVTDYMHRSNLVYQDDCTG